MSEVLERLKGGVDHVVRHLAHRSEEVPCPPQSAPIRARSRTAAERREALARFRAGPGAKTDETPEFEAHAALIEEKLAGTHHNVIR